MKRLSDYTKLVPEELLVVGNLKDLIEKINEIDEKLDEASAAIDDAQLIKDSLIRLKMNAQELLASPSIEKLTNFINLTNDEMSHLNLNASTDVTSTDAFKKALVSVEKAKAFLAKGEELVLPIGQQESFEKDIKFTKEHTVSPKEEFELGYSVKADAKFSINVLNHEQAKDLLAMPVKEGDVVINQDAFASFLIGGKASAKLQSISASIGASLGAEIELDTYYQINTATPSYKALWAMYSDGVKPWNIKSMQKHLQFINNQGFRAITVRGKRQLSIWGEVALGESFSTSTDINNQSLTAEITAAAGYSRKHTYEGDTELFMRKNKDNQLEIKVSFDEKTVNSSNFSLSLKSEFTGLDKIVTEYTDIIFGRGDELIAELEKYSTPGKTILKKIKDELDEDAWYASISQLVLGEKNTDQVVTEMLGEQIQEFFDSEVLSVKLDPKELSRKVIDTLMEQFGSELDKLPVSNAEKKQILKAAVDGLSTVIGGWQTEVEAQAQSFVDKIKAKVTNEGRKVLAPIESLSKEIKSQLERVDQITTDIFSEALTKYQEFKTRVNEGVKKAQTIKLAIAHEQSKSLMESEALGFTVVFLSNSKSAQSLYQLLVVGADQAANRLMRSLAIDGQILIKDRTQRIQRTMQQELSQSLSIMGIDFSQKKVSVGDLSIETDAGGSLSVINRLEISDTALGKHEERKAVANLAYQFANAGLSGKTDTTFNLAYRNVDKQMHSKQQMEDIFKSFSFTKAHLSNLEHELPEIVSPKAIERALIEFDKYRGLYKKSTVSIQMLSSKFVYKRLTELEADPLFDMAADFLRAIYVNVDRRKFLEPIYSAYKAVERELDYSAFFDFAVTNKKNFIINPRKFRSNLKSKFKNTNYLDDSFWESTKMDGAISGSAKRFKAAVLDLTDLGQESKGLSSLPSILSHIDKEVRLFSSLSQAEKETGMKVFKQQLASLQDAMEEAINPWIDVNSVGATWVKEKLRIPSNVNYQLLMFMSVLSELCKPAEAESLFLVTITLEKEGKAPRVIVLK